MNCILRAILVTILIFTSNKKRQVLTIFKNQRRVSQNFCTRKTELFRMIIKEKILPSKISFHIVKLRRVNKIDLTLRRLICLYPESKRSKRLQTSITTIFINNIKSGSRWRQLYICVLMSKSQIRCTRANHRKFNVPRININTSFLPRPRINEFAVLPQTFTPIF